MFLFFRSTLYFILFVHLFVYVFIGLVLVTLQGLRPRALVSEHDDSVPIAIERESNLHNWVCCWMDTPTPYSCMSPSKDPPLISVQTRYKSPVWHQNTQS